MSTPMTIEEHFNEYEGFLRLSSIIGAKSKLDQMYEEGLIENPPRDRRSWTPHNGLVRIEGGDEDNILSLAIKYLSVDIVRYILENTYADVNILTRKGMTPLMIVSSDITDHSDEHEEKRAEIINLMLAERPNDIRNGVRDIDGQDFKWYVDHNDYISDNNKVLLSGLNIGAKKKSKRKSKKSKKSKSKSKSKSKKSKSKKSKNKLKKSKNKLNKSNRK